MNLSELQAQGITTRLFTWEDELAGNIGIGRTFQNKQKQDRASYDKSSLMDSNELANIHAVVSEIGVCKILGAYCYAGIWTANHHHLYSDLPDGLWVKTELEIKWRRTGMKMPIDRKDYERNRLVLWAESKLAEGYNCSCESCSLGVGEASRVRLLGGGMASELWDEGAIYNGDKNRVGVPLNKLQPITQILTL